MSETSCSRKTRRNDVTKPYRIESSIERQARLIAQVQTKVPGSLGSMESCAIEVCRILDTLNPSIDRPTLVLAAADHGVAASGVTCSGQCVSAQMVELFASGNGTCAVLCRANGVRLDLVDVGLACDIDPKPAMDWIRFERCKTMNGTSDFSKGPAMGLSDFEHAFEAGVSKAKTLASEGCNTILLGEMGVGNTASAGALMSVLCRLDATLCLPRGSSTDEVMARKVSVVRDAVSSFESYYQGLGEHSGTHRFFVEAACRLGGLEIVYLAGVVSGAHSCGMLVLNDGFITTVSVLLASKLSRGCEGSVICCHYTGDRPHDTLMEILGFGYFVNLGMHLGEGTGALAVVPLVRESLEVFRSLKPFAATGVSCRPCDKCLPFALGTSSYILPDDILPNVDYLCDKVDDVELVLFESGDQSNLPDDHVLDELGFYSRVYGMSYTVHLPYDVKAGSFDEGQRRHAVDTWLRFMERTKDLNVHGFIVHLEPERYRHEDGSPCLEPSVDVPRWMDQVVKSMDELKAGLPSGVNPKLVCIETLSYDLMPLLPAILERGFSITLDVGHLWLNGLYSPSYVRTLLPHTRIIHLHGVDGLRDHQSLAVHDKGVLAEFLGILREFERTPIVVTLEVFSKDDLSSSLGVLHSLEAF